MKETILITGGHGLIAGRLAEKLNKNYEIRFLTRNKQKQNDFEWDVEKGTIELESLIGIHHIIHLSGANIAEKRWTKKRKMEIISSRVDTAKLLLETLKRDKIKIQSFISASAVGFYGSDTTQKVYTEEDHKGMDFLSNVVFLWEQIADRFCKENIAERVVKLRAGVVLSEEGGALPKIQMPIEYYLGAALGSGKQYMPWIHIDDLCAIYEFAIKNSNIRGVYNAASPMHTTNQELTKAIADVLKKPILFPNIPSFIIKLIFGETSSILLGGSRVSVDKIKKDGFVFTYPDLKLALKNLLLKK